MTEEPVEPVQVFVRIRPESTSFRGLRSSTPERKSPTVTTRQIQSPKLSQSVDSNLTVKCATLIDDTTIKIMPPDGALGTRKNVSAVDDKIFSFDKVFAEESTQEEIYQSVSAHVKATVSGYNTTIFAYGSTGSGKSFTMTGNSTAPGIIPRAISEIFSIIEATAAQESDVFFYVRLSYVELYNNNFRNLLEFASKELTVKEKNTEKEDEKGRPMSPTQLHPGLAQRTDKIEVRESQSAGVFLAGPSLRIPVTTAQEAFQLVAKGNKVRAVGSTQCNDVSSRSHAILTLHVESRVPSGTGLSMCNAPHTVDGSVWAIGGNSPTQASSELRLGKMHLVDLAGSERVALSGAEGDTLLETQSINLSLTAIGDVLSALSRNAMVMSQQNRTAALGGSSTPGSAPRTPLSLVPVPYRNSKLTHLLKDSLGGNSKTIMVATIRTDTEYYQQTAVTLKYASRAKKVRNRSLVNRNVIGDTGIHAVTNEIERLKTRLDERSTEFEHLRHTHLKDSDENNALRARLQHLKDANESEKKQLETQMSHIIHSQAGQLASQRHRSQSLQQSLQDELAVSQERIAKQEREILGLKKALDDSVHQPVEQMEKMQRVMDAQQAQAVCAQQEIERVLREAEALRESNATLSAQLRASDAAVQQLHAERDELDEALTCKAAERDAAESRLVEQAEEMDRMSQLLASASSEGEVSSKKLQQASEAAEEAGRVYTELQAQLSSERESAGGMQDRLLKANARVCDLESDKAAILLKLEDTVGVLEQRTTVTIEKATSRLQDGDRKLKTAEGRLGQLERELQETQNQLKSSREDFFKASEDSRVKLAHLSLLLDGEKAAHSESSNRCAQLNVMAQALNMTVSEKDALLKSAKIYLEDTAVEHNSLVQSLKQETQDLRENQKIELESLLNESENLQTLHEKEKAELTQKLYELVQDLRLRDEEEMKSREQLLLDNRDMELTEKEKGFQSTLEALQQSLTLQHTAVLIGLKDQHTKHLAHLTEEHTQDQALLRAQMEAEREEVEAEAERRADQMCEEAGVAEDERNKSLCAAEARFEKEVRSLHSQHLKEQDELRGTLVKENAALAEQLEDVENELRKEVENAFILSQEFLQSQRVVENAFSQNQEFLQSQQQLLEDRETAHDKALKGLQTDLLSDQAVERERASQLLSQLRAEHERAVRDLIVQHDENVRTALEYQKERLTAEAKESVAIAMSTLSGSQQSLARQHQEREEALRTQHQKDREQSEDCMALRHEEQLEDLRVQLEEELRLKMKALGDELEGNRLAQLQDMQTHYEDALHRLSAAHDTDFSEAAAADKLDLASRLDEVKGQNEFKLEELRIELCEEHSKELAQVVGDMRRQHEEEVGRLKEEQEEELKESSLNLAAQLQAVESKAERRLSDALQDLRVELSESYEGEVEGAVRLAQSEHEAQIERINATHEVRFSEEISADRHGFATQMVEIKSRNDERLTVKLKELRDELCGVHAYELSKALTEAGTEHEKHIDTLLDEQEVQLNQAVATEREGFSIRLKEVCAGYEAKMARELEQQSEVESKEHSKELTQAVGDVRRQHEEEVGRLKELFAALEQSTAASRAGLTTELEDVQSRAEFDVENVRMELSLEHNKRVAVALTELQGAHDREMERLKGLHHQQVRVALEAQAEDYREVLEHMRVSNEERQGVLLEELRRDLTEAHAAHTTQLTRDLKTSHEAEKQSALCELKSAAEGQYSSATRDLIEKLGQDGRNALEAQRVLLLRERGADLERVRGEIRALNEEHDSALLTLKSDFQKVHTRAVEEVKKEMESGFKVTLRDREKASERAAEACAAQLQADKDLAISNIRAQQELALDKQRGELKRLRAEALETEMRHQKALGGAMERGLEELTVQRGDIEAAFNRDLGSLRSQLAEARERYGDAMAAGTERQGAEMRTLRLQREEFDSTLEVALLDRDAHHKQAMKALSECHEAEQIRLSTAAERERERFESDLEQLEQEHALEVQKAETAWRLKAGRDLAALQDKHTETLTLALGDAAALFRAEMCEMQEERQSVEEALRAEAALTDQEMQDLMVSLSQLRSQLESEGLEHTAALHRERGDSEQRHAEILDQLYAQSRDREEKMMALHKEQLALVVDQSTAESSRALEELGAVHIEQVRDLEGRIEDLHSQLELESCKTRDYQVLADQQMEFLRGEFKDRFRDLQDDFEARSEELKTLLSEAHTHALVSAHAHGEHDVKAVSEEYTAKMEVLQITHTEKLKMLESLHDIKLDTQRTEYLSNLEQARDGFEADLQRLRHTQDMEAAQLSEDCARAIETGKASLEKELKLSKELHTGLLREYKDLQRETQDLADTHDSEIKEMMRRHSEDLKSAHTQGLSETAAAFKAHEDQLAAVRQSSEKAGFERARRSEQELEESLSRSLAELRDSLQRQHEVDLDALSEEAVKVTNRLKAKLTSLELKNEQTEEYNTQLTATRAKEEAENIRIRQRLQQLEAVLKGREEAARGQQAQNSADAARDVAEIANRMESLRERLVAECSALRLSEKEHKRAFEAAIYERDCSMADRQRRHKAEVDRYEQQSKESSATIARLSNDLRDLQESTRALKASSSESREASALVAELTRGLEKAVHEKGHMAKELKTFRDAQGKEEKTALESERRCRGLEEAVSEEQRRGAAAEEAARTSKVLLQKAERRVSQLEEALEGTEGRRREIEGVAFGLRDIQESTHEAACAEISRLKEEVVLGKTYVQGLMLQMEHWDRDRDRDRDRQLGEFQGSDLRRALAVQQNEMQGGYLNMLMSQVSSVMQMIQKDPEQNTLSVPQIEELMKNMPEEWKQKQKMRNTSDGSYGEEGLISSRQRLGVRTADQEESTYDQDDPDRVRTWPFHQPKQPPPASHSSALAPTQPYPPHVPQPIVQTDTHPPQPISRVQSSASEHDWSTFRPARSTQSLPPYLSQSLQSLQSLQDLISEDNDTSLNGSIGRGTGTQNGGHNGAQALGSRPSRDGAAQVTARGENLRSGLWKDLGPSILPLHRAVSGLHFHGSLKKLLSALAMLIELGADPCGADKMGNTALHNAVSVCTSKSVASVVGALLCGGSKTSIRNQEGETPLHLECKRVRRASPEVVSALLAGGADPSERTGHSSSRHRTPTGETALTLLLRRCAADRQDLTENTPGCMDRGDGGENSDEDSVRGREGTSGGQGTGTGSRVGEGESKGSREDRGSRVRASPYWAETAHLLLRSGATWDPSWRSPPPRGETQLHVLVSSLSVPPSKEHSADVRALITSALSAGLCPYTEEGRGRNAIFLFCDKMSRIPLDAYPCAPAVLTQLIEACTIKGHGLGGSDCSGVTLFDIPELVPGSCLGALKPLIAMAAMKSLPPSSASSAANTALPSPSAPAASSFSSSSVTPHRQQTAPHVPHTRSGYSQQHPTHRA